MGGLTLQSLIQIKLIMLKPSVMRSMQIIITRSDWIAIKIQAHLFELNLIFLIP